MNESSKFLFFRSTAQEVRLGRVDDKADRAEGVNRPENVAILDLASIHNSQFAPQSPA